MAFSNSRPQSPDLSGISYAPESPDLSGLSGLRPDSSPEAAGLLGNNFNLHNHHRFPPAPTSGHTHFGGYQPTSVPQQAFHEQQYYQPDVMAPRRGMKTEDEDEYMPDAAPSRRSLRVKQEPIMPSNGAPQEFPEFAQPIKSEDSDPTLGCTLTTSFPVARIKRIMQADDDIGKVAQVTPTVVSRALELFMIKLISASANQARGPVGPAGGSAASKGPKRVLAQHLKKAVVSDEKFDFLNEIVGKVPDAPTKAKKEVGSDSEDPKPKKKGKKRKDSGDDF